MWIYKIVNQISGKVYVGKTSCSLERRMKGHITNAEKHENRHLYDAMNHYGYSNFIIEPIEEVGNDQEANERERFWIKNLNTISPIGYNMTEGGDGGNTLAHWSEEDKEKLWKRQGKARKGHIVTEQTKEKLRLAFTGRRIPSEMKDRIRVTCLRKNIQPPEETKWVKGQTGAFTGNHHSDKTKNNLRDWRLGKSYEEILGEEAALIQKDKKRKCWEKEGNPNFVELTIDHQIQIVICLKNGVAGSGIEKSVGVSMFKIRQFLRKHGIMNLQRERQQGNWRSRLQEIENAIGD